MFSSELRPSQKVETLPEIENRSTVLQSTISSRAKQATCSKTLGIINFNEREVLQEKLTERIPLPGKAVHNGVSAVKKSIILPTERISRTVTRKDFKRERDNQFIPVTKIPIKRSIAPHTERLRNTNETERDKPRNKSISLSMHLKTPERYEHPQTLPPPLSKEMAVQTNEKEILNYSLLVGDIKFLKPSQHIVKKIEKLRKDLKTQRLLKATRKFEAHSERQEEHLDDLKEFLEKSYVTKKTRKTIEAKEEEQRLFTSMDQLFNRNVSKIESIVDIKARIKHKEQELLKLFDGVDTK